MAKEIKRYTVIHSGEPGNSYESTNGHWVKYSDFDLQLKIFRELFDKEVNNLRDELLESKKETQNALKTLRAVDDELGKLNLIIKIGNKSDKIRELTKENLKWQNDYSDLQTRNIELTEETKILVCALTEIIEIATRCLEDESLIIATEALQLIKKGYQMDK